MMQACLHVWYALSNFDHQSDHYTFAELARYSNSTDELLISRALLYLSNPRLRVLKTCLMYEFDGMLSELPAEEAEHYSRGDQVIHPEYGEPLPEDEIILCFTPGPELDSRRGV
ncbi:hypothetical protein [Delftia sp.]|uniref:hypothetical protein n=1 Tax=Delftia sp. TaxID=1886637 RepID=UPI00259CCF66|nr:hypothetical protein [Delftia sp.]